jgi:spore germination protein YaaH
MERKLRLPLLLLALIIIFVAAFPVLADDGNTAFIKFGSRGEKISELQRMLQEAGFFPAGQKITGYFGYITYGAVAALEKKYGLPVDGQVGQEEWEILYNRKLPKTVMGYYTVDYPGDRQSHDSLLKPNLMVNQVAMFDFCVDSKGNLTGNVSYEGIRLAKRKGCKPLMVVHNIAGGTYNKWAAGSAISVESYRRNLVDNIVKQVKQNDYEGVNIDLEGIPPQYRDHFNTFLEELSSRLKPGAKLVTVTVPAKTSDDGANPWSGGYDYKTIGRLADLVVLMTYDEHWSGGPPGPVASVPWVAQVLDYSVKVIPPYKILMGIACYGYDWPAGSNGRALKWKDVPALAGQYGNVKWDNYYCEPYLTYWKNGIRHQVWFENRYSLAIKLVLVKSYGLGGIAFWRMGFEDASFWETLNEKL